MITIYGFLEGPAATGGWVVSATCECGARLVEHTVAKAEDARDDIMSAQKQRELYREHCVERHNAEAFQVRWVDDPSNYQGLRQADVEVVDWSEDDLSAMAGQLRKAFPGDDKKALPENDCQ